MKTNSTQKEILLITGTRFTARQGEMIDNTTGSAPLNEKQKLEQACWNGLLKDILPELFKQTEEDKNLFLWQVREAGSYLELEFGSQPQSPDHYFSIDPYSFLPSTYLS